jgi:hypothetical protein
MQQKEKDSRNFKRIGRERDSNGVISEESGP